MAVRATPDGYHSVTPYLSVIGTVRLLDFLVEAFGAEITERFSHPDGGVRHAEARIGDSSVMITEANEHSPSMPTGLYLYIADVDATYRRALAAGATSMSEPADQFYGDRAGGVVDPSGNHWWIATHVEDVSPEELERRMASR